MGRSLLSILLGAGQPPTTADVGSEEASSGKQSTVTLSFLRDPPIIRQDLSPGPLYHPQGRNGESGGMGEADTPTLQLQEKTTPGQLSSSACWQVRPQDGAWPCVPPDLSRRFPAVFPLCT